MSGKKINSPFTLPCGLILENRLVKAAMTERISDAHFEPTSDLNRLYNLWSKSGAGLLISGNVMVDRKHLESAGNVCFDDEKMLPKLMEWASAGKINGNQFWVQISHSGRQTNRFTNSRPFAPSEVQLSKNGLFGKPKALTEEGIQKVIDGFVNAAKLSKEAGFTGVQIHSAHGYLLSEFLSPIANIRKDQWGGSIENRSRLLLTIIRETRKVVGDHYPISVKLNSSDFQHGGFTEDESLEVVKLLDKEKIDLLEISGGTYEKVEFLMMNEGKESTRKREAYFIEFAHKIRTISQIPLMITGGFRSYSFCNEVLEKGELDLIGMARPFITNLDDIPGFLNGEISVLENLILRTGIKQLDETAEGGFYARQIMRYSKGKDLKLNMNPLWSSIFLMGYEFKRSMFRKFFASY